MTYFLYHSHTNQLANKKKQHVITIWKLNHSFILCIKPFRKHLHGSIIFYFSLIPNVSTVCLSLSAFIVFHTLG